MNFFSLLLINCIIAVKPMSLQVELGALNRYN